uniref:Uncharacterized protein n=1 Tax=Fibrocapsa japonica TaxID=94617 RepID=A0A7S2UWK2_9STRA|mmetsp:Transcript_13623/g.20025  ORF Transcript_13623/g.20025 Transcript_13623/m.20025 type:complete len:105 (+) Transcript_13623:74-388(+)
MALARSTLAGVSGLKAAVSRMIARPGMQPRRKITEVLLNKENKVPSNAKVMAQDPHLHGAEDPTFLRNTDTDCFVVAFGVSCMLYGGFTLTAGSSNMANGTGKL